MNTLEHAIKTTGGVSKLADALGIRQNVVSNWRARNRLPTSWEKLLLLKYPMAVSAKAQAQQEGA